jgi:hypothetical protein
MKYVQVEALVPVRVEGSLGNRRCLGLLTVDRCNGERVGKAYKEGKQVARLVKFTRLDNVHIDKCGLSR